MSITMDVSCFLSVHQQQEDLDLWGKNCSHVSSTRRKISQTNERLLRAFNCFSFRNSKPDGEGTSEPEQNTNREEIHRA